jgi:hypothetical protein
MRNDARPIGYDQPPSDPLRDTRDSLKHDRQSPIVNPPAEEDARHDNRNNDPALPTGDSTLKTNI